MSIWTFEHKMRQQNEIDHIEIEIFMSYLIFLPFSASINETVTDNAMLI